MRDGDPALREMDHNLERAAQVGQAAPQRDEIHIRVMLQRGDGRRGELQVLRQIHLRLHLRVPQGLPEPFPPPGQQQGCRPRPAFCQPLDPARCHVVMCLHGTPLRLCVSQGLGPRGALPHPLCAASLAETAPRLPSPLVRAAAATRRSLTRIPRADS